MITATKLKLCKRMITIIVVARDGDRQKHGPTTKRAQKPTLWKKNVVSGDAECMAVSQSSTSSFSFIRFYTLIFKTKVNPS